ncbi:YbaB/EbfC family nucleoid-associated protein [Tsukamurella soli]|uniref:YbaB/EbfC family nucleoid-associated protein n=1 Tax=Tsukamurella soli TaxID=644556 RepID=UPI0031E688AA
MVIPHACDTAQVGPEGDPTTPALSRADEVRESLARVSGTGTAARGDVRVTVAVGGRLTGVVIGAGAMTLSGAALAAEIMTATSLASLAAAREVHSVASRFYPDHEMWGELT